MIEFEDFGVARGIAQDFRAEKRLAKIYVEDTDGEGWKRREKGADGGARNGIALRESAEANGMRGTSQGNPVF